MYKAIFVERHHLAFLAVAVDTLLEQIKDSDDRDDSEWLDRMETGEELKDTIKNLNRTWQE